MQRVNRLDTPAINSLACNSRGVSHIEATLEGSELFSGRIAFRIDVSRGHVFLAMMYVL